MLQYYVALTRSHITYKYSRLPRVHQHLRKIKNEYHSKKKRCPNIITRCYVRCTCTRLKCIRKTATCRVLFLCAYYYCYYYYYYRCVVIIKMLCVQQVVLLLSRCTQVDCAGCKRAGIITINNDNNDNMERLNPQKLLPGEQHRNTRWIIIHNICFFFSSPLQRDYHTTSQAHVSPTRDAGDTTTINY